jgi:type IV pilus assembly protein PilY1
MKRQTVAASAALSITFMSLLIIDALYAAVPVRSNSDYASIPPFVSESATPNILILMDNSGSMTNRACESSSCGKLPDGTTSNTVVFTATTTYSGLFDPLTCYAYNSTNNRFEFSSTKSPVSVGTKCTSSEWDGNFVNWGTFRRFDAVKKAMIGGDCYLIAPVTARNVDGTCPPSGSPSKITIKAQTKFDSTGAGHETACNGSPCDNTNGVPSGSYDGRVPATVTSGTPALLYLHVRGGTSGMQGTFCVDNDRKAPGDTQTACNVNGDGSSESDGFTEKQFTIRLAVDSEPTGVIQQVGKKARFGLMEFKDGSAADGGRVLTGIGSRQSINFADNGVETFNTNTAAMIDAVEESYPATWTPLSESLYEAIRYFAQIQSNIDPNNYVYPIAYSGTGSGGVGFQTTGAGSVGSSEISALTGTETCPAGYISNACGRDPYFFGSNHTPPWATPSKQITCCKSYIMIFTDGEPTMDDNGKVPAVLRDDPLGATHHASGVPSGIHGLHCTGGNTTIHLPNGTCNTNAATLATTLIGNPSASPATIGEHKTDYADSGSHYLDDVAYWGHTVDLRPDAGGNNPCGTGPFTIPVINVAGHCLAGNQNVTVYTFFAFGNIAGRELLMQTAKQGAFEDSNGNNKPDLRSEYDKEDNYTGAPTPDGIPDAYFESSNVDDLEQRLLATISSILKKSSSGTSASVLASSSTGEGAAYQAYFYPGHPDNPEVKWTGYVQGFFVDALGNLREDTVNDGKLDLRSDYIIKMEFNGNDVVVKRYVDANADGKADLSDTNGDGTPDTAVAVSPDILLKDVKGIWEAGKQLSGKDPDTRKIYTWSDQNNDGNVDSAEWLDFTTANASKLKPYLRASTSGDYTAANIIKFIRGESVTNLRNRQIVAGGDIWKLGDAINSTPTIVGAPKERYDVIYGDDTYGEFYRTWRNRRQVAYVGANDGMLHAFNAGFYHRGVSGVHNGCFTANISDNCATQTSVNLGNELWGFIPMQLLPHLKWLADPNYQHTYYVDLKPKVTDVRIFCNGAGSVTPPGTCIDGQSGVSHPGGWGTILIGGFRFGGSCKNCTVGAPPMQVQDDFDYPTNGSLTDANDTRTFYSAYFVLDITDPDAPGGPKLLWIFTNDSLGLTTSYPTVLRVKPACTGANCKIDSTNAGWYAVFGSGPTSYRVEDATTGLKQAAKLFAVNLAVGPGGTANSNVTTINLGAYTNALAGDVITVDTDLDYRVNVAYSGTVIHDGTLPWRGNLFRLTMNCTGTACHQPAQWGASPGATNPVSTAVIDKFGGTEVGPIPSAPTVTKDDSNKIWLFFGTGRYYNSDDKLTTEQQRFYGVKDPFLSGNCATESTCSSNLTLLNVTGTAVCSTCTTLSQVSGGTTGVTTFDNLITKISGNPAASIPELNGWVTNLLFPDSAAPRERVTVSPTLLGGVVFFPSFVPIKDYCDTKSDGYLYGLFYLTGTANKESVVGTADVGTNKVNSTNISMGQGQMAQVGIHIGAEGSGSNGSNNGGGCQGGTSVIGQSSSGAIASACVKTQSAWSRYLSWNKQRL